MPQKSWAVWKSLQKKYIISFSKGATEELTSCIHTFLTFTGPRCPLGPAMGLMWLWLMKIPTQYHLMKPTKQCGDTWWPITCLFFSIFVICFLSNSCHNSTLCLHSELSLLRFSQFFSTCLQIAWVRVPLSIFTRSTYLNCVTRFSLTGFLFYVYST